MKSWKNALFLGALPGVELEPAEWICEARKRALVVNLVPQEEIREKCPDYLDAKGTGDLPLVQEATLPSAGPVDEGSLRRFWEKAFVVKACIASGGHGTCLRRPSGRAHGNVRYRRYDATRAQLRTGPLRVGSDRSLGV